jgi:hypothetical protein
LLGDTIPWTRAAPTLFTQSPPPPYYEKHIHETHKRIIGRDNRARGIIIKVETQNKKTRRFSSRANDYHPARRYYRWWRIARNPLETEKSCFNGPLRASGDNMNWYNNAYSSAPCSAVTCRPVEICLGHTYTLYITGCRLPVAESSRNTFVLIPLKSILVLCQIGVCIHARAWVQ